MGEAISGTRACVVSVALALLLGACASTGGGSAVFGNLLAFNSINAPPQVALKTPIKVDCPQVSIDDNGSDLRAYAGADHTNDTVRYQFDIGQLARQCSVQNGQILIKVGVAGRVLIGPAGSSGVFTVPIRIALRRESDKKVVSTQVYRQSVAIPAGRQLGLFTLVSQPLTAPYTRRQADEDYSIRVGFDQGPRAATRRTPKRRRRG